MLKLLTIKTTIMKTFKLFYIGIIGIIDVSFLVTLCALEWYIY